MPKTYVLDKFFKVGTLYRSEPDKYYVVESVGTTDTAKITLKVAGAPCLSLIRRLARDVLYELAPERPVDLEDLFIVIPRDKPFELEGTSGKGLRAIGRILELAPGEVEATRDLARFSEQAKRFLTYQHSIGGIGASATWAAGAAYNVLNYTCPAGEKHKFNRFMVLTRTGVIASKESGNVSVRFKINDAPLDVIDSAKAPLGIDTCRGHPYVVGSIIRAFSMEEMPISLNPGVNLKIDAVNISGADITTGAGEEAKVEVWLWDETEYL